MLRYELKKLFSRPSGKIALLLLAAVLVVTTILAANVSYVNEAGQTEHGPAAVRQLRTMQKTWAGPLTEERLQQVIEENNAITQSPEYQSTDITQNEMAYHRKQGFEEIRQLMNMAFSPSFRSYDYYTADQLGLEDAASFYSNRSLLLETYLQNEGGDLYTPEKQAYLLNQYQALDTPWDYDYMLGWTQLFEFAPTVIMVIALISGFLVSGIFSLEIQQKSDAIFFSALHGRGRGTAAKVGAGFCLITVVYWLAILAFSGCLLLYLGADGAACPIQAHWDSWKSFYNITVGQEYLLLLLGGYLGCLFLGFLTMLASAKTNSTVFSALIPFIAIFLPAVLLDSTNLFVSRLLGLLPDRLLQISRVVDYFDLYQLGGTVVGSLPILLAVYSLLTLLLAPVLYQVYRRKQLT